MKLSFCQVQKELWLWRWFTPYTEEARGFSSIKKLGWSASPSRDYFEIVVGGLRAPLLRALKTSKEDAVLALEGQHLLPISCIPIRERKCHFLLGYRSLNLWHFKSYQLTELLNLHCSSRFFFFKLGGPSSSLFQNSDVHNGNLVVTLPLVLSLSSPSFHPTTIPTKAKIKN